MNGDTPGNYGPMIGVCRLDPSTGLSAVAEAGLYLSAT
jgi:hypothetical protein